MKNYKLILLFAVLILGFIFRLYKFDNPIADWHSWRQADTSSVSRNFLLSGFDLLHPKFDDLSNVASGQDNPQGYRFVEFPIYNALQAVVYKAFSIITLEESGRLVNITASMFSAVFIFLILYKRFNFTSGFFSLLFFLFMPFNIYYSRVILPDPLMVSASLGGIYFFQKWIDQSSSKFNIKSYCFFMLSLLFTACAFLIKPYALFFTLPIVYLAIEKFKISIIKNWKIWLYFIIAILPLVLWRNWIQQFPEGIPASNWLFNGNGIRFKPSFFYWIIYERLTKLILGFTLLPLLFVWIFNKYKKNDLLFIFSFVLSAIIYVVTLATGNVQHDYYQILIIPSVAVVLGLSVDFIIGLKNKNYRYLLLFVFSILTLISFISSWNIVKDYFNVNNWSIVTAGKVVDELLPKNSKIIANYNGDTSFLYQTKRKGWSSFQKSLPEMSELGAEYLILVNPTSADLEIGKIYKIVKKTDQYVIFSLKEVL